MANKMGKQGNEKHETRHLFLIICAMSFSGIQTAKSEETAGVSVEDIYASETNMATLYF